MSHITNIFCNTKDSTFWLQQEGNIKLYFQTLHRFCCNIKHSTMVSYLIPSIFFSQLSNRGSPKLPRMLPSRQPNENLTCSTSDIFVSPRISNYLAGSTFGTKTSYCAIRLLSFASINKINLLLNKRNPLG